MNWFLSNPIRGARDRILHRKRISEQTINRAPMYSVFVGGPGVEIVRRKGHRPLKRNEWDLFEVDDPTEDVVAEAVRRYGMEPGEVPQLDDENTEHLRKLDYWDDDATLEYLAKGGSLIKLPDSPGSKYWRMYVIGLKPKGIRP